MNQYSQDHVQIYKMTEHAMAWRKWAEIPSLLRIIGNLTNLNVLDAACGTGINSRRFEKNGAAQVTGIDSSGIMIEQAKALSTGSKICYLKQSIENYQPAGLHDLAVSSFLFNEARSTLQLKAFCAALKSCIKIGGKVTVVMDFVENVGGTDYSSYGLFFHHHHLQNGDSFKLTITLEAGSITLDLNYYSPEFVQNILEDTGFNEVQFFNLLPSPEGIEFMPSGYWNTMICRPFAIIVCAKRNK